MEQYISPLQKYAPKDFKGLIDHNHLGAMYQIEPYKVSPLIHNIFSVNNAIDPFMDFINRYPAVEVPAGRMAEWYLQGRNEKNVILLKACSADGSALTAASKVGQYGSRWFMVFPEDYFDADHILVGMKPDLYKVRVVNPAEQRGNEYWYLCELVTNDASKFVALEDLASGTKWSIDYTLSPQTLSTRGTGVAHTSPFAMWTEMSFFRKEYTVPGSMIDEGKNSPLCFSWKDPKTGKTETTWIGKLEYDFRQQYYREVARMLMFGESNRQTNGIYANKGNNGYEIRAGMGLRGQIAPANKFYYSKFNLKAFIDFVRQLTFAKFSESERDIVVFTGEWGLSAVSQEIENLPSAQALAYGTTGRFQGGVDQMTYHRGQFVKVVDIQGIKITFVHLPMYDDLVRNKQNHPTELGIAESHRMTIMDFGKTDGEPNIQRLVPKGQPQELHTYIPGLRNPFSPTGSWGSRQMTASAVDGYSVHSAFTGGIMIKNPMRMGEWIPNVLA